MPPLDHATLQAVLDKQGMPNTTENLNRIAQFAAVAPDMLDKYLGQGTDQARVGSNVNDAIGRSVAATDGGAVDPRLAQLAGPNPYTATLDPNTGMSNIGPGLVKTPEPRAGGGGGARVAGPTPLVPQGPGRSRATDEPPEPPPQQAGGGGLDWLLPAILGLAPSAINALRGNSGKVGAPGEPVRPPAPGGPWNEGTPGMPPPEAQPQAQRALPAPQQKLPAPPEQSRYPSGAPEISKDQIYEATKPGVQAELDAAKAAKLRAELLRAGRGVIRR